MTGELLQHVVVTIAAIGAAGVLVRRIVGLAAPRKGQQPACGNCASARRKHPVAAAVQRLTFFR